MNTRRHVAIGLALMMGLSACDVLQPALDVQVTATNAKGLQVGDPVDFNGVVIGKVSAVEPSSMGAVLHLALDAAQASAVQSNASATLVAEPGRRAVTLRNPRQTAAPIADGARLQASEPPTAIAEALGEAATKLSEIIEQTAQTAKDYFDKSSQDWQRAKERMRLLLEAISEGSEAIGKDLHEQLEAIIRELESELQGKGRKAQPRLREVQAGYKKLDAALALKEKALESRGKADAAAAAQELRDRLASAMARYEKRHDGTG
ncbi:MAG: MlaD family protein [Gammaproteobacteria bacterium]